MAATSTNKQPLLVDRVLHSVVNTDSAAAAAIDIAGTNTALVLVDGSQSDGCIIESIYAISRGTTPHTINLYISGSNDYLRPVEGVFVGSFASATTAAAVSSWDEMPKILAPVAQTGTESQFRAFYLPKGSTLWVARQSTNIATDGPLVGAQGGWY